MLHPVFLSEDGFRLVEGFARGLLFISWSCMSGTLCLRCNFKDFRGKVSLSVFGGGVALFFSILKYLFFNFSAPKFIFVST